MLDAIAGLDPGLSRGPCSKEQKGSMLAAGPFGSCQC